MIIIGIVILTGTKDLNAQTLKERLYNKETRQFTLDEWIVHDLYRNKEENYLLRDEVRFHYTLLDSLKSEIALKGSYANNLETTIEALKLDTSNLSRQLDIKNGLYGTALSEISNRDVLIKEQKTEINELKRKGWVDKILDFGWGPFKLKFIVPFGTGYWLGKTFG